ncbi:hypothetical protein F4777DRAFT_529406 [Nemania sp. FL0916]|nr:hypothetical protein F4777DRAFT_529406 [Nemania sp. FL0916]
MRFGEMNVSISNYQVCFDYTGAVLVREIGSAGPRSAERRANKFSFLEEITAEQMKTYSPAQLATVLKQREDVLDVLSKQYRGPEKAQRLYQPSGVVKPPPGFEDSVTEDPWVPRKDDECQTKYCHQCRPSCEPRAYLSLDGVLKGEVPPTAATGFGFHRMGSRPIMDAKIIQEIGYRPVPLPRAHPRLYAASASSQSTWTLSDILEVADFQLGLVGPEPDLEMVEESSLASDSSTQSQTNALERPRPSSTPPPTPTSWTGIVQQEEGSTIFEYSPSVCDGRSPRSLSMNEAVRRRTVESVAGLVHQESQEDEPDEVHFINSTDATDVTDSSDEIRSLRAELALTMSQIMNLGGGGINHGPATPMMAEELEEGRFHPDPLDVGEGIAVLEESVELGVPDVITQM